MKRGGRRIDLTPKEFGLLEYLMCNESQQVTRAQNIEHVRKLNEIAQRRGQSLAQMALAWTLRGGRITSALIGASKAEQVRENAGALKNLEFSKEELAEIDRYATEGGVNLWEKPSTDQAI